MGFSVAKVVAPRSPWRDCMASFYDGVPFMASRRSRARVANDHLLGSAVPWDSSLFTHLAVPWMVDSFDPATRVPDGWAVVHRMFKHDWVGGGTDGEYSVGLLLPPGYGEERQSWPLLAWRPGSNIASSLACRSPATPLVDPPVAIGENSRTVVQLPNGSVASWGLLPAAQPYRRITLPYDRAPSGFGLRSLLPGELSDVWNTPILLQDHFRKGGHESLLGSFVGVAPAKVLAVAADYFISYGVRGGFTSFSLPSASCPLPSPPPKRLCLPHAPTQDVRFDVLEEQIIKQDGQKADDAEIPTHLWDAVFKETIPEGFPPLHPQWRQRLDSYREIGMRFWRVCLSRSFWWYIGEKLPNSVWSQQPHPSRVVVWIPSKHRYEWRRKKGRFLYQQWTQRLFSHTLTKDDWEPARDCMRKAAGASWWSWDQGSTLFFWNWPCPIYRRWARDGQPHYQVADLPTFRKPQQPPKTPEDRVKVRSKIQPVRARGYIESGKVISLMHYFYVLKGVADIRMVYNGTSSGVNGCLFSPHFGLATIRHTFRALARGYKQTDLDAGEMFLNFPLGELLRAYSGVDVTHIRTTKSDLRQHDPPLQEIPDWERERVRAWERWCRNWMGLTDSPYRSCQMMTCAKETAFGDRHAQSNPFRWDRVVLNLPYTPEYDSSMPWVYKARRDGSIASDAFVYVDDVKGTGQSGLEAWKATCRLSSKLTHHGIQDAKRKRTSPSMTPGPWAGSVAHTDGGLFTLTSKKQWGKAQSLIQEVLDLLGARPDGMLPHYRLLQIRGFLVYVSRSYSWMPPYLKGLHGTIDSWRPGRDKHGFKLGAKALRDRPMAVWQWGEERWIDLEPEEFEKIGGMGAKAPELVRPLSRLRGDFEFLREFTTGDEPVRSQVRPTKAFTAVYLMGDASGKGFGSALWNDEGILWESGHYETSFQEESSNFREAHNLVTRVEKLEEQGVLDGQEGFVITDNSTFESTFFKGYSTSRSLTELIFRLRQVERRTGCVFHAIHVAGTRMKASGIDGLSRGDLLEGMMKAGADPFSFLPISQGAGERMPIDVEAWVNSWWRSPEGSPWCGEELRLLTPNDWFDLRNVAGPRLWMPPPTAMETVVEMFGEDRLIRPHLPHVFVVPRLMTHLWRKALSKDADLVLTVPAGQSFWPATMHEPLIVLIVLPLTHVDSYRGPWLVGSTDAAAALEKRVRSGFATWRESKDAPGKLHELEGYLPGLWSTQEEWFRGTFPPCMNVWCGECYAESPGDPFPHQGLPEEDDGLELESKEMEDYRKGRDGDHLMAVPFECDLCHYRNLRKRDPDLTDHRDVYLLTCIRRAVLDACWARRPKTVSSNLARHIRDYNDTVRTFGLRGEDFLPKLGWPVLQDRVGMALAVQAVHISRRPGRHAEHIQFSTVRKTHSWYTNAYTAGMEYNAAAMFVKDEKKTYVTTSPANGEWFTRFKRGMKLRMGEIRIQNNPFTSEIVLALDKVCEEVWASDPQRRADVEDLMCYVLAEYCGDLRGEEVPLLSLTGLLQFWNESLKHSPPYIMLTLHGKFKGETGSRWHLLPIPTRTRSKLPTGKWFTRAVQQKTGTEGREKGWFFADQQGKKRAMAYYDTLLAEFVETTYNRFPEVIGESTDLEQFSLWRSGRRGATTAARNCGVDEGVITMMGRWRKVERARGTQPGLPMSQVYTEVKLAVPAMLRFASQF